MSGTQHQRLFGTNNELAKERNRAAAERTINAWIGTCLSFVGVGVAIDQISRSLQQRFPDGDPLLKETVTHITSIGFVGAGLVLLFLALIQHRLQIKTIEREDYVMLSVRALNRIVVAAILLTGFLGIFMILFLV